MGRNGIPIIIYYISIKMIIITNNKEHIKYRCASHGILYLFHLTVKWICIIPGHHLVSDSNETHTHINTPMYARTWWDRSREKKREDDIVQSSAPDRYRSRECNGGYHRMVQRKWRIIILFYHCDCSVLSLCLLS